MALACDHIILADDGASSVALPEVPLLAVLPGTGGLTRVTDKRKVRRDLADVFCSTEEGVKGKRAKEWKLVDDVVPNTKFAETALTRAREMAAKSTRSAGAKGIELTPLERKFDDKGGVIYSTLEVEIDRGKRLATLTIHGPERDAPASIDALHAEGAGSWVLRAARELDDAILHLRNNEYEIGVLVFRTQGDPAKVASHEKLLLDNRDHWLASEILLLWKRVLKRVDLTSRSLVALVEPGSCFAGMLAEILFAVDRSYMAQGHFEGDNRLAATVTLTRGQFRPLSDVERSDPAANALSRRAGTGRCRQGADRRTARSVAPPASSASSPSPSTISTGTTKCAFSWRSAPAFRPTP